MKALSNATKPRVLVLEGLSGDTARIIDAAGGNATEVFPWDIADIQRELESGIYDALVLTGGSDIDPKLYGARKVHKSVYGVDQVRDTAEYMALDYATDLGIPVLGICRGSQIICAYRGGKLTQDIDGHRSSDHQVVAETGAKTFKRAIGGRRMEVVSLHHQCVKKPGKGMRIAARAYDHTPEAIESKDGLWLGVQFHPELAASYNGQAFAIFQWLVRAAADFAGVRATVPTFKEYKAARAAARERWLKSYTPKAPVKVKAAPKHRPAGALTLPKSAKESARVFECSATELELRTCEGCGMLFDNMEDKDDHWTYVCPAGLCREYDFAPLSDWEIDKALRNIS